LPLLNLRHIKRAPDSQRCGNHCCKHQGRHCGEAGQARRHELRACRGPRRLSRGPHDRRPQAAFSPPYRHRRAAARPQCRVLHRRSGRNLSTTIHATAHP
jgi:hypothetical protein